MYQIIREPDAYRVEYEEENGCGASLRFEKGEGLKVFLGSPVHAVRSVTLRWNEKAEGPCRVLGDDWERLYGNAEWRGIVPERVMPWYMLVSDKKNVCGMGVKVRPNAMCYWQLDYAGVTLVLDVSSGSAGVRLGQRELMAAQILCENYPGVSPFEAAKRFCLAMTDSPVFPSEPVYGSNNWYYAYGNSSHGEILTDSAFVSALTSGLGNRPYMVIDDGWSPNMTAGPWDRGNEKFPDMARLAREMKETGVKPGLWFRPLYDLSEFSERHSLPGKPHVLDPGDPAVLKQIGQNVARFREWGFGLVKHDYSSVDISGAWGSFNRRRYVAAERRFCRTDLTTAEIVKEVYRTIYENAGDMVVLGCNCLNHLCVGYVHANRVGDDTSGVYWERTRKMGVNALAFRLCQDGAFFKADADCVGLTANIPWEKNKEWLRLISKSGTPLFVSARIGDVNQEIEEALRGAFASASVQKTGCEPLDWMHTTCPSKWRFEDGESEFSFDDRFGVDAET